MGPVAYDAEVSLESLKSFIDRANTWSVKLSQDQLMIRSI